MIPSELSIMLEQWARANAPNYGLTVDTVQVAILSLSDEELVDEVGDRGGFFPFSVATLTVVGPATFTYEAIMGGVSVNDVRRRMMDIEAFERLYLQVCHDIWMSKNLAVRGRLIVR